MAAPSRRSSANRFASSTSTLFRSISPARVNHNLNLHAPVNGSPSVRFSQRSISPNGVSSSSGPTVKRQSTTTAKKRCMCSPTSHPGSFRCSLHKGKGDVVAVKYAANGLNARRSAMTNSLVRICGVEGELGKRALASLIRPSSHHQRRRACFVPRPTRLSIMSNTLK